MKRFLSVGALALGSWSASMKRSIPRAACMAVLGFAASTAGALMLNPQGTGQVLIFPYYTVNAGHSTLLSIVNTTAHAKALKLRFHEARNGRDVFDLNIYLSRYDTWVAQVFDASSDGTGAAAIATRDNSCTVPALPVTRTGGVTGAPFSTAAYTGTNADGGPATPDRTREGHFDVIEMGEVTNESSLHTLDALDQYNRQCDQLVSAWNTADGYWTMNPTIDLAPPAGGLYGSESVINVAGGTVYSFDAMAIDGFSSAAQHTAPSAATPDLDTASADGGGKFAASVPVAGHIREHEYDRAPDAVSALFMADRLYNEYIVDPAIGAQSDWVVTAPTKRFYVDPKFLGPTYLPGQLSAPFDHAFGTDPQVPGTSCSAFDYLLNDRDGYEGDFGIFPFPSYGAPIPSLCFETNVLTVGGPGSLLGSRLPMNATCCGTPTTILYQANGATAGNYILTFNGQVQGVPLSHALSAATSGAVLTGLPLLGFLAVNYINANVTPGVLSNYSAAYAHHSTASCTNSTTTQNACH